MKDFFHRRIKVQRFLLRDAVRSYEFTFFPVFVFVIFSPFFSIAHTFLLILAWIYPKCIPKYITVILTGFCVRIPNFSGFFPDFNNFFTFQEIVEMNIVKHVIEMFPVSRFRFSVSGFSGFPVFPVFQFLRFSQMTFNVAKFVFECGNFVV